MRRGGREGRREGGREGGLLTEESIKEDIPEMYTGVKCVCSPSLSGGWVGGKVALCALLSVKGGVAVGLSSPGTLSTLLPSPLSGDS